MTMDSIISWLALLAAAILWLLTRWQPENIKGVGDAQDKARRAIKEARQEGGVALLLQVLWDLEADLETVVLYCDFEGDPDDLILEGWKQAKGGLLSMSSVLRDPGLSTALEQAGLTGPAMEAKATAYYYWRARAGLDLAVDMSMPAPRGRKQPWENTGTGFGKSLSRRFKKHAPKALRIGDIIADSAIAVLDAPGVRRVVAAGDAALGGALNVGIGTVKLAAHGTSEMKKIVEESKITRVRIEPKEAPPVETGSFG
jgi:hypothetical protein